MASKEQTSFAIQGVAACLRALGPGVPTSPELRLAIEKFLARSDREMGALQKGLLAALKKADPKEVEAALRAIAEEP
jgi:hypothetical protein